jgi:hypothetical protein
MLDTLASSMTDQPLFFFFVDTNTAVYDTHLFVKRGGLQVVRLLRELRGQIALPDVSRVEYLSNYAKGAAKAYKDAEAALSQLETLSGQRMAHVLPKEKYWESRGIHILDALKDITFDIVSTDAIKAAALDRAVQGRKPAKSPNQDIKDCLIWECILSLPAGSEVIFASRDLKAFYGNGKFDEALVKEAEAKGILITPVDTTKANLFEAVELLKSRVADVESLRLNDLSLDYRPPESETVDGEGPAEPVFLPEVVEPESLEQVVEAGKPVDALDTVAPARKFFHALESKALGFVSYLGRAGKQEIIELLTLSGANADATRNSLERLALAGMIRDTGNNYLRVDSAYSQQAAALVEDEMIKLTGLGD